MIKYLHKIFSLIIVFIYCCEEVDAFGVNMAYIHTDRYCYVSGDIAFFKIYLPHALNKPQWEQTVYIDLFSSNEGFVCGELLRLSNGMASGYFSIPDTLLTGDYEFRAYTDQSASTQYPILARKHVFITNRFAKKGDVYSTSFSDSISLKPISQINNSLTCSLRLDKDIFKIREQINVTLSLNLKDASDTLWASLTVRPFSLLEQEIENRNNNPSEMNEIHEKLVLSNIKGIKFSGCLVNNETLDPIAGALVFLSFEDTILRLEYDITDEHGVFCFYLTNYFDKQTAYLTAYSCPSLRFLENTKIEVLHNFLQTTPPVSNDTSVKGYRIIADTLNISRSIVSKAYNINYMDYKYIPLRDTFLYTHKFMTGKLTNTVEPDNYVIFNDFSEMAKEILPFIRYKQSGNTYQFSVLDPASDIFRNDPLVFVDGVPLIENKRINDWGTEQIKRIEVKSQPRFYGDVFLQNGMILIWTKKMNFWSNNTNGPQHKVEIQFCQRPISFRFPEYSYVKDDNFPDFRQTLFWEPEIVLSKHKQEEVVFYTSDERGKYEIVLEGISQKGQRVCVKQVFTVE